MPAADPPKKKPGTGAGKRTGGAKKTPARGTSRPPQRTAAARGASPTRSGRQSSGNRPAAAPAQATTQRSATATDTSRTRVAAETRDVWAVEVKANTRRAVGLTLLPAGILAAIFIVLTVVGIVPAVVGVILAVLVTAVGSSAFVFAPRALLRKFQTVPADPVQQARLYNVVEGLCLAWGLPQPELRLLADHAPNALAIGRTPDDAVIVCTTGLVNLLDRIELEAVFGHELAHVRNLDILSGSIAAGTIGYLALVNGSARRALIRLSGAGRESLADQASVGLTRYPPAMISALDKMAAAPTRTPAAISHSVALRSAHLWLVPLDDGTAAGAPGVGVPEPSPITGALSLDERIELLRQL